MPRFSSKHTERETTFSFSNFTGGCNHEVAANFLSVNELSICKNIKFAKGRGADGSDAVILKKRQGTEIISNTALTSSVLACAYYIAGSQYIVATASKIYYLDESYDPVEIGSISGVPTFTEFKGKLIIHDSGVTKAWNGTTLETLTCLYEDEDVGTGDGANARFTGNLDNLAVSASSVMITFTASGVTKTITDDGSGALTGDVNAGGTNTIVYSTGAYDFTCSAAPDNTTPLEATYEQVSGAPKSKAGSVRASRLYMWGDSDNPSRLWYSGVNDEDAWDTTSDGGYLDVDPEDGQELIGVLDFYDSLLLMKNNSLYRLDNFPGDTTFRVEPLIRELGCVAYRTAQTDGEIISFLSKSGWTALHSSERFGDIQKAKALSNSFHTNAVRYANSLAYTAYNQIDSQLWLTLYDETESAYFPYLYAIDVGVSGQMSIYEFAFTHSCYSFVNNEMLIGGSDGHLYRLLNNDSRFLDNTTSYDADTYIRTGFFDLAMPHNRKHVKKINARLNGKLGMTATLNLYTDNNTITAVDTISLNMSMGDAFVFDDGRDVYVYDMAAYVYDPDSDFSFRKRFNNRSLMAEITNIHGTLGAEIYGLDVVTAILGD